MLPLLTDVRSRIVESVGLLRAYDGQWLPAAEWDIVRSIVFERDRYACLYCGSKRDLAGDHIVPLCHGGSNAFRKPRDRVQRLQSDQTPERRRNGGRLFLF